MTYGILKAIRLVAYDFDGVMTDNKVIIDSAGKEAVVVNRADGLAIAEIRRMGIDQIIISTESNPVVLKRAEKLGVVCFASVQDKKEALEKYLRKSAIKPKETLFVGNDLNDLEAMKLAGVSAAPKDAHPEIKKIATFVTKAKGGDGVVRELLDMLNAREWKIA